MRIDAHVHGDPHQFEGDPAQYVAAVRAAGVDKVVLIEPIERCLAAMEKFGADFIIPVARVSINDCSSGEIAAAIGAGAKGIKFIRPHAAYDDRRYWPLYQKLEELGAVAVFHTGYLARRPPEDPPVHIEDMRAAHIDAISRRFPELRILMAHFSNPWWEEAWKVIYSSPNVYADLSGGTAHIRSLAMWAQTFAPDGVLHESSLKKLLFASDVHYFAGTADAFRAHLEFYLRLYDRLNLPETMREDINGLTAAKLFGLTSEGVTA